MLNIVVPAEKGSALVFENLHMYNGEQHVGSLHAACPMLKGNKWSMYYYNYLILNIILTVLNLKSFLIESYYCTNIFSFP